METKAAARQTALQTALNDQVTKYRQEIQKQVGTGESNSGASYTVVTVTSGHTMRLGEGCEVMLRSGAAKVTSAGSPTLVDMSTGSELNSGAALTKNHLYMAVGAQQVIAPTTAPVKLLARGIYTIT